MFRPALPPDQAVVLPGFTAPPRAPGVWLKASEKSSVALALCTSRQLAPATSSNRIVEQDSRFLRFISSPFPVVNSLPFDIANVVITYNVLHRLYAQLAIGPVNYFSRI